MCIRDRVINMRKMFDIYRRRQEDMEKAINKEAINDILSRIAGIEKRVAEMESKMKQEFMTPFVIE